jgi:hypothetical protein
VGYRPEHFRPIVAPRTAGVDVLPPLQIETANVASGQGKRALPLGSVSAQSGCSSPSIGHLPSTQETFGALATKRENFLCSIA